MLSAYELILLIGIILTILFIHYNNRGRRKIIEEQVDLEIMDHLVILKRLEF